jgi:hypothetical protein
MLWSEVDKAQYEQGHDEDDKETNKRIVLTRWAHAICP